MLGVVFTELLEMVEDTFGDDVLEDLLDELDLESGGAYTAVGSYSHSEIVQIVVALSKQTNMPVDDLVIAFGKHLMTVFVQKYPGFFDDVTDSFTFLSSVDQYIHKEVLKLYPNAELPKFDSKLVDPQTLEMTYSSVRPFSNLAKGLIEGTLEHFGEKGSIATKDMSTDEKNIVQFTITKQS